MRNSQPESVGPYLLSALSERYDSNMALGATTAERMIYTTEIPAWPETSPGGTAYAVLLDHTADPEDAKSPWHSVQYSKRVTSRRDEKREKKATSAF
ncbi:hypothetical protein E4U58_005003 [Claviceps cyperi]|nr:hypothetical protein E4U58_005003 [Claviceps cyperi]